MLTGPFLLVPLILMAIAAMPIHCYSRRWGYLPSGGLSAIVVGICAIFLLRIS